MPHGLLDASSGGASAAEIVAGKPAPYFSKYAVAHK